MLILSLGICGCGSNNSNGGNKNSENNISNKKFDDNKPQNEVVKDNKEFKMDNSKNLDIKAKEPFYGEWKIVGILKTSSISAYTEEDLKSIIGSKMIYSDKEASCFGDEVTSVKKKVKNPKYKKETLKKDEFEKLYKGATFKQLGIKENEIKVITTEDKSGNGCTILLKNKNSMIINGGGAYLNLARIK